MNKLAYVLVGSLLAGSLSVNVANSEITKDDVKDVALNQINEEVKNEVDLNTKGNIVEIEKSKDTFIKKQKAKEIAFKHAGVQINEVTRLKIKLDKEDKEYEVEFYVGTTEYDYEINAVTGKIINVEKDVEKVKEQKTVITKDKALMIALEKAGVKVNETRDLEVEYDDGKYEISFEVKNVEYEVEVSLSGKVLKFEKSR